MDIRLFLNLLIFLPIAVHDIRSFVIGAFLSSLLLKEQMISDRKASGGFEHKIAGLKKATFISS